MMPKINIIFEGLRTCQISVMIPKMVNSFYFSVFVLNTPLTPALFVRSSQIEFLSLC